MNDNKLKKQRKLDKAGSHFLNISTVNVPTWRGALAVHRRCTGQWEKLADYPLWGISLFWAPNRSNPKRLKEQSTHLNIGMRI